MCTISFIPVKDKYIITSNRDEKIARQPALPPAIYHHNGTHLLFPKDADAHGTWIAAKENGDVAVLLNGAFLSHVAEPPYRKSRGLIFLDIFSGEPASIEFARINLYNIEPFTLVLFENNLLYEFRWDGAEKYSKQLATHLPHTWSSATLYDGLVVKKREQWFKDFLTTHPQPLQKEVIKFHCFGGDGDTNNDLMMRREGHTTVSITSIELNNKNSEMVYLDLKERKIHRKQFNLNPLKKIMKDASPF